MEEYKLPEEKILDEVNTILQRDNYIPETISYKDLAKYVIQLKQELTDLNNKLDTDFIEIPKGTHCCNKGCVRCGSLNEDEAEKCWNENHCDTCDMRKRCYQQYIINKDTSVY